MDLKSLMVDTKDAWVEFPGCDGFEVQLVNLARKELVALRKRCIITKFDRNTRQPMETLDEEKFVREFAKATVKSWKGLKLKYLEELLLVNLVGKDPESLLEYTEENGVMLVENSSAFDTWINGAIFDLENFRSESEDVTVGKTGKVAN